MLYFMVLINNKIVYILLFKGGKEVNFFYFKNIFQ